MDKEKVKAVADQVFGDMAGAMTAGLCYVGCKTGLFNAMAGRGPMTTDAVVAASGLQPRYVDEWLKGMTSAGYLDYDPTQSTFSLSEEHAYFVASEGTDHYVGGLFAMAAVLLRVAPRVAQSFRDGGGVPFQDYGEEGVVALDMVNRGQYEQRFASYWLKAMPETAAALDAFASRWRKRFRPRRSSDSIRTANRSRRRRKPPRTKMSRVVCDSSQSGPTRSIATRVSTSSPPATAFTISRSRSRRCVISARC